MPHDSNQRSNLHCRAHGAALLLSVPILGHHPDGMKRIALAGRDNAVPYWLDTFAGERDGLAGRGPI